MAAGTRGCDHAVSELPGRLYPVGWSPGNIAVVNVAVVSITVGWVSPGIA
jgi:hypothetical protein